MSENPIKDKINDAKDSVGVITPRALHDELGKLTPDEWRAASAMFPKNASDPDGFYITDDANGKVTIHNDMRTAHDLATNSVWDSTVADAESAAKVVLPLDGLVAVSGGLAGSYLSGAGDFAMTGPIAEASVGAFIGATVSTAVVAAEVTAVVGAVVFAGDMVRNWFRSWTAEDDLKGEQNLTV